jgi:uncharacterized protein (TIGR02391 family)
MDQYLPPASEMLEYEPGVVAPGLLKYLHAHADANNLVNPGWFYARQDVVDYAGGAHNLETVGRALDEAWLWLVNEGMIARAGSDSGNWHFITRKGIRAAEETQTNVLSVSKLLPIDNLDDILRTRVRPLFLAGDYDTAVFRAYKEVEVRTRRYAGYDISVHGIDVTNRAFKTTEGPLSDTTVPNPEQDAMRFIFSGALGLFRNPSGHRDVHFDDPSEVAEIILTANLLLRLLERRQPTSQSEEA